MVECCTKIDFKKIRFQKNHENTDNPKIFQVNVLCNQTFDVCKYRDEIIPCCEHFHPIYSEHGFCFAFNSRYIDQSDTE